MPEWTVQWTLIVEAEGPMEAAEAALTVHRDPHSIATVFTVHADVLDPDGVTVQPQRWQVDVTEGTSDPLDVD